MSAIKRQEYNSHNEPVSPWEPIKAGGSAEIRPLKVVLLFKVQDSALFFLHQEVKELLFIAFQCSSALQVYIICISLGVTGHDISQNVMFCLARHSESCNTELKITIMLFIARVIL